jgi:hypothetical protein
MGRWGAGGGRRSRVPKRPLKIQQWRTCPGVTQYGELLPKVKHNSPGSFVLSATPELWVGPAHRDASGVCIP